MKLKISIMVAFAAMGSLLLAPIANANPDNPTYVSGSWSSQSSKATAFVLRTSGGLLSAIPPIETTCSNGTNASSSTVLASISPGITARIGARNCDLRGNNFDYAETSISEIKILGGLVTIKDINSKCFANNFTKTVTVGSTYGSMITDANYSDQGSGALILPDGTTVAFNVNTLSGSTARTVAVVVYVPGAVLTPSRTILLGGCELKRSVSLLG
jgi:hypothetical protein